MSGRLLTITDFVDNLKLNSYLKARISDKIHKSIQRSVKNNSQQQREQLTSAQFDNFNIAYWSHINKEDRKFLNIMQSANLTSENKCLSKKVNYWQEESCQQRRAYICEFDAINMRQSVNKPVFSLNNGNRLIRVKCGSGSTPTVAKQTSTTTQKPRSTTVKTVKKPIKVFSALTGGEKTLVQVKTNPALSTSNVYTSKIMPILSNSILEVEDQEVEITSTVSKTQRVITKQADPEVKSSQEPAKSIFSLDLVLIVAVICGVSIVLVAINVFCIWNYYK